MKLAGSVALVTGSGRNIGRAIALALADAGADVVVNARSSKAEIEAVAHEIEAKGRKAIPYVADIRDPDAVCAMVTAGRQQLGPIDILVNCAAIRPAEAFENMTYQQWRDVVSTILDAAYLCANAVVPHMLETGRGTIINISGQTGQQGSVNRAHVVAAKSGLIGFTKALALEFATRGITANCISPGSIDTGGSQSVHAAPGRFLPMGRKGRPEEIASLCCYLASDEARYITGQVLAVNGGSYT